MSVLIRLADGGAIMWWDDRLSGVHVEFRLFGPYREAVGARSVRRKLPEQTTVKDAFAALSADFDEFDGDLAVDDPATGRCIVTVNKRNVRQLDGAETELADGDVVRIAPAVAGGCGR